METFSLNRGDFLEKSHNSKSKRGNYTKKNDFYNIQKKDSGFPLGFNENPQHFNWIPKRQVLGSQKYSQKIYGLHPVSTKKGCGIPKRVPTPMGITMPLVPILPSIKNVKFRIYNPPINNEFLFKFRPKSQL